MGLAAEVRFDVVELAGSFDVDLVVPVDHDLADLAVPQKRLQRAVAEDLVGHLLRNARAVGQRERRLLGVDDLLEGVPHASLEFTLVEVRVVQLWSK